MKNLLESSNFKKFKNDNILYKSNLINILFYILLLLIIISIILISFLSKFILQAKNLIEFNSKMIFKNHLIEDIKNFNSSNLSIKEKKLYKMLCPRDVNGKKKILVGNFGDGGYVLFDDFEDIKIAYSFGINKEISFDKYLANKGINVYMYDHTIDSIPSNDTKLHWKKIGLGTKNSNKKNLKSLEELLLDNGHINEKNMILKIDIEHNEWDPLKEIPKKILKKFKYIILELHFFKSEEYQLYLEVLKKLTNNHQPFHIHCSNCGGLFIIGDNPICRSLEISFIIKKDNKFKKDFQSYPIKEFDYKICTRKPSLNKESNILKYCDLTN